jgi:hypothetical protein
MNETGLADSKNEAKREKGRKEKPQAVVRENAVSPVCEPWQSARFAAHDSSLRGSLIRTNTAVAVQAEEENSLTFRGKVPHSQFDESDANQFVQVGFPAPMTPSSMIKTTHSV